MKSYWVYILASRPRGTLYVGMTNDLVRRAYQHREGLVEGDRRVKPGGDEKGWRLNIGA